MRWTRMFNYVVFIPLITTILCFQKQRKKTEDYLGCCHDDSFKPIFEYSPGDYDPYAVSPASCMQACGVKYKYAGIEDGRLCLCSKFEPSSFVDDTECSTNCPQLYTWPNYNHTGLCGGVNRISVYNVWGYISGLTLKNPGVVKVYEPVFFEVESVNGKGINYSFFSPDDHTLFAEGLTEPKLVHYFVKTGTFEVIVKAENNISVPQVAQVMVTVHDSKIEGRMQCDKAQVFGSPVECIGEVVRGSPYVVQVEFGDKTKDLIKSSVHFDHVGDNLPSHQNTRMHEQSKLTVVMLNAIFYDDCIVTALEFLVASTGTINIQIYRPVCEDVVFVYCVFTKRCQTSEQFCTETQSCKTTETYCFKTKMCVRDLSTTCENNETDNVGEYDLLLVDQRQFDVLSLGHKLYELERSMMVETGDVLGWSTENGAWISFVSQESSNFELIYPDVFSLNSITKKSSGQVTTHNHALKAHIVYPGKFYFQHNYVEPGSYFVKSNLSSTPHLLYVDVPVEEVKIECQSSFRTNSIINMTLAEYTGTNVTYIIDFKNGTVISYLNRFYIIVYSEPGVYGISISASNSVAKESDSCVLHVLDEITELRIENEIKPVAMGSATSFRVCVSHGTNITYHVFFGDGNDKTILDFSYKGCVTVSHIYANDGLYEIMIKAENQISRMELMLKALVEIPISEMEFFTHHFHLSKYVYVAVNDVVWVEVSFAQGSNIKCTYNLSDATSLFNTTQKRFSHSYKEQGMYDVIALCWNAVSRQERFLNATIIVEVPEKITGLQIHLDNTIFGQISTLTASMVSGSLFFCTWNFGNGRMMQVDQSLFFDVVSVAYPNIADYSVNLTCINPQGVFSTSESIGIDIPISGLRVSCPTNYKNVSSSIEFEIEHRYGSRVSYEIVFGDDERDVFHYSHISGQFVTIQHVYTKPGVYDTDVRAWNSVDEQHASCPYEIVVQKPIGDMQIVSNSPIKLNPGISEFYVVKNRYPLPTNATIVWDFDDQSQKQRSNSLNEGVIQTHTFLEEGFFHVIASMENLVSRKTFHILIEVQEINTIVLSAFWKNQDGDLVPGDKYFAVEKDVHFNVTSQPNDESYKFNFGDGSTSLTSKNNIATHMYSSATQYVVSCEVENILGEMMAQKIIILQESIAGMNVEVTPVVNHRRPVSVNITAIKFGSQLCGEFDFGENIVYIFNRQYCKIKSRDSTIQVFELNYTTSFEYMFKSKGYHDIFISIYNHVSSYSKVVQVFVKYRPCPDPEVSISGGGINRSYPFIVTRNTKVVLQSNVTMVCDVADNATFYWIVYKDETNEIVEMDQRSAVMPFLRLPGGYDPTVFEIFGNSLPYGLIYVELLIKYNSEAYNVSNIKASDFAWLDIQASALQAKIEGGIRRATGYQIDFGFDASLSRDPDQLNTTTEGTMSFTWYCRRSEEAFPTDLQTATDSKSGCFENGHYLLTSGLGGFTELNHDASKVSIFTDLVKGASYTMRVVLKKGRRESYYDQEFVIHTKEPPSLLIYCSLNCFEKTSPSKRLKIQSVCTNCEKGDVMHYYWRLYEVKEQGTSKPKKVELEDLQSKITTPITSANIALKESVMQLGMKYILRVAARMNTSTDDEGGFSDFMFTVNQPPRGGFCHVIPLVGVTLNTVFEVKCGDWSDEDSPLLYRIDSVRDGIVQSLYVGPEREVSMILPMGSADDDYKYKLIVTVEDKFHFGVTETFTVKVTAPLDVNYNRVTNNLKVLADSNNLQALSRMAVAVGSVMNKPSQETSKVEAKKSREKMIKSLSNVKACTLTEIKQMGGVQLELTQITDEVSEDAQDESGKALDAMSNCMSLSSASDSNMESVASTMFMATSNILGASMTKNVSNFTTNSTERSAADKLADTIDKIGGAFMRQMVASDKPKIISTNQMQVRLAQIADNADEDETGFKLPNFKSIFGNQSDSLDTGRQASVGAMVTSMADNPYKGTSGSDDIKSDVMGLALTGHDGQPLDLAGQEMTMFMNRDLSLDEPTPEFEYLTAGAMSYHLFNVTSELNAVVVRLAPIDPKMHTQVFIAHEKLPTVSRYLLNYTQATLEQSMKQPLDPFTKILNANDLNGTGSYYMGVKLTPSLAEYKSKYGRDPMFNYTMRVWETVCKVWDEEMKMFLTAGCTVGPKTTFNKTQCTCLIGTRGDYNTTLHGFDNATIGNEIMSNSTMLNFVNTQSTTTSTAPPEPLALAPRPPKHKVVKRATFAGGFIVAPNTIDFAKAFAGFSNIAENPIALSVVLSMLGVYLLLLFWARREDRKDIMRAGVTALVENHPNDRQFYEITIYTGFTSGASTTANVFLQLCGDEGECEVRQLKDSNRQLFKKRSEDVFLASFSDYIGDLQYVRVWHDNTGKSPSWYLSRIMVHDLNSDRKYLFINDNMLAVESGAGSLERLLSVAGPDEIKGFNHLFFSTSQKNITDGHIWFSVFIRPPKSRFTRVQRLSCCLTLLYCTMVTNAMFYKVGKDEDQVSDTLHVGPFSFSPSQIGIAVTSSLLIFPINIFIVGVFRSVGVKPSPEEMAKKKAKRFWWLRELLFCWPQKTGSNFIEILGGMPDDYSQAGSRVNIMCEDYSLSGSEIGLKMETGAQEKARAEKEKKLRKQRKKLPYWMKYFAWILLVMTSFTAAFFVVLYGFQFGKEVSAQWMSALLLTLVQDIFVSQPVKILGLALFIALIVKKPPEDDDEDGQTNKKQIDEDYINSIDDRDSEVPVAKKPNTADIIRFKPPSKERISALRNYRLKEIKMYNLIRELCIYLIFVVALCQVTYSHMDPKSYMVRQSVDDLFVKNAHGGELGFYDIHSTQDVWHWLNGTVVNSLYNTRWYNMVPKTPGFTQDLASYLFGGARLRQLRIEKDSCKVHPEFERIIQTCHDWYSVFEEETEDYAPGWKTITNQTRPSQFDASWKYQSSSTLETYPFMGKLAAYTGGGYIGYMGKHTDEARHVISHLFANEWLDQQTRALFLEVTVYNAQVNLFAIVNLLMEISPINGVELFDSIRIARLYTYSGSTESFTIACQFFVLMFFVISIYREGKKIYRQKKAYFRGFWNLVEFVVIILVVSTMGVFFSRMNLVNSAVKRIEQHPGEFVSFNKVVQWDVMFSSLTSILVLLNCIKSIRLLQYNQTISLLASTLKGSAAPLAAFFVVFVIFFMSFTCWAYLMFMPHLSDYKSFVTAFESVMALLLGGFHYEEISKTKPVLGSLWFVLIMLFGVMYIMNVFLTIIMETYASVKEDLSMQSHDYELVEFMTKRFMEIIGRGDSGKQELLAEIEKREAMVAGKSCLTKEDDQGKARKRVRFPKTKKKYVNGLNGEIDNKFSELDDSLNAYWDVTCNVELIEESINKRWMGEEHVPDEATFDYHRMHEEVLMQRDLQAELARWS